MSCSLRREVYVTLFKTLSYSKHFSAEKELVEFLTEEIAAEKKLQKTKNIPSEVCGFKVKLDGSEVSLSKIAGDET